MTKTNLKKLEAAHHRWQRRILGVIWREQIKNEDIRKRTSMEKMEDMLKRSRLRWLGHIHRSDNERFSKQALDWTPTGWRRKRGRPRKTWRNSVIQGLDDVGITWEEAKESAEDRVG